MDKQIGLRPGARVLSVELKRTKNDFPMMVIELEYPKSKAFPELVKRSKYLATWDKMDEGARKRLKEECRQLLEAFEVPNAKSIATKHYAGGAEQFFEAIMAALPKNYKRTLVDIFTEYEYALGTDKQGNKNPCTWPQISSGASGEGKNGKEWQVLWISPAQDGEFTEHIDENGLKYVNEQNQVHPINRGKKWLESTNCNRIGTPPKFGESATPPVPVEDDDAKSIFDDDDRPF